MSQKDEQDSAEGPGVGRPREVGDDQIFAALATVITEDGPNGVTLNKVASRLKITGPALGYRFKNKRGLLLAFAARQPSATEEHFDVIAREGATPRQAIAQALVGILDVMETRSDVANNLAMLSLDLADDELAESARTQARIIKSKLGALANDAGVSDPQQRDALVDALYVTWSGSITSWAIDGQGTLKDWTRTRIERVLQRELD
jgi:AcrR family transcriptional regulator